VPGPAAEAASDLRQDERLLVPHVEAEDLQEDLHLRVVARVGRDHRGQLHRQQVKEMSLLELPLDVAVVPARLRLQRGVEQFALDGLKHPQGARDGAEGAEARSPATIGAVVGGEEPLQVGVSLDDHRARIHRWSLLSGECDRSCRVAWGHRRSRVPPRDRTILLDPRVVAPQLLAPGVVARSHPATGSGGLRGHVRPIAASELGVSAMPTCIFAGRAGPSRAKLGGLTKGSRQ